MVTELKPTNLIAVEVPKDAIKFKVSGTGWLCYKNTLYGKWSVLSQPNELYFGFKTLSIVTKDKIGFDVEPYIKNDGVGRYFKYNNILGDDGFICISKEESFYSLLAANGLYFENPLDWEKKAYLFKGSENSWGHDDLARWQSYEDKLIRGKLLIIEKL